MVAVRRRGTLRPAMEQPKPYKREHYRLPLPATYPVMFAGTHAIGEGTLTNLSGAFNDVTDVYGSYSSNSRPNNNGTSAKLTGAANTRLNQWFNRDVFSQAAPYTFGTAPRTLPDTRWHGTNNLDFGLFKNNRFGADGRYNIQFRSEFFNGTNHVRFGVSNLFLGNAAFGVISSQANIPRQVQLALKFLF